MSKKCHCIFNNDSFAEGFGKLVLEMILIYIVMLLYKKYLGL
ncbi:hypothetical protein UFOVP9_57 [uncultured Caudovirales phage]|jgi:hypothetical protein|uniref:Uncharacterized protein n=1 Tax=uncultured Caudovirales phage TaxID=2100421 RepID=A0A6J5KK52_9CAUD|nr:hypothetical protein UFOVP9_57 [uncultured Caudovirales phage]